MDFMNEEFKKEMVEALEIMRKHLQNDKSAAEKVLKILEENNRLNKLFSIYPLEAAERILKIYDLNK